MKYINLENLEKLINECYNSGYDMVKIKDSHIAYGDFVLVSPDDKHCNFIVREDLDKLLLKVRTCKKLSKQILKEMDSYEYGK